MSHLGTTESRGEEEEGQRETGRPAAFHSPVVPSATGQPSTGQLLFQTAWQNMGTLTGQQVPLPLLPSVLPSPDAETTISTETAQGSEGQSKKKKRAAPTDVKPLDSKSERQATSAVNRLLSNRKHWKDLDKSLPEKDYYITSLDEILAYALGHPDYAVEVIEACNNALGEENDAYHLTLDVEPESDDRTEKKPKTSEPYDFAAYWGPGQDRNARINALSHFVKHGQQAHFSYDTVEAYSEGARQFKRDNSGAGQAEIGSENKSIIAKYSRSTQTGSYLVADAANKILSYYPLAPSTLRELGTLLDMDGYLRSKVADVGQVYTD